MGILDDRPDPSEQKFWLYSPGEPKSRFLLERFKSHYNDWLKRLGVELNIFVINCIDIKGAQEVARAINDVEKDVEASWCRKEVTLKRR